MGISKNRGEVVWTPTYKIALLQSVETEKIFSKEIMRELLLNVKYTPKVLAPKRPQDIQTTNWVKAVCRHVQLECCKRVNWIIQETGTRYVMSEIIQLYISLFLSIAKLHDALACSILGGDVPNLYQRL